MCFLHIAISITTEVTWNILVKCVVNSEITQNGCYTIVKWIKILRYLHRVVCMIITVIIIYFGCFAHEINDPLPIVRFG